LKTTSNNGGGSYNTTWNERNNSHQVQQIVETFHWVDGPVEFDYQLIVNYETTDTTAQIVSFGSPSWSKGINSDNSNGAIDGGTNYNETLIFTVTNISNIVNADPGDITFDGFTGLGLFFSDSDDDGGALMSISGGVTNDLWSYAGALGEQPVDTIVPAGSKITGNSTDDTIYTWFGYKSLTHAQVDLSATLPQVMAYQSREGATNGLNRVRINNVGVQFTVAVEFTDTDGDGLYDFEEVAIGTSINDPDTDSDTFDDFFEHNNGMDPTINNGEDALSTYVVTNRAALGLFTDEDLGLDSDDDVLVAVESGDVDLSLQLEKIDLLKYGGTWTNEGPAVEWSWTVDDGRSYYNIRPGK
jgi:hypothetical protein